MSFIGGVLPTTWVRAEDLRMTPGGELHISTEHCSTRAGCRPVVVTVAPKVKPEEPTGVGAVVRDADGLWVLVDSDGSPWYLRDAFSNRYWDEFGIDVEVLAAGVSL